MNIPTRLALFSFGATLVSLAMYLETIYHKTPLIAGPTVILLGIPALFVMWVATMTAGWSSPKHDSRFSGFCAASMIAVLAYKDLPWVSLVAAVLFAASATIAFLAFRRRAANPPTGEITFERTTLHGTRDVLTFSDAPLERCYELARAAGWTPPRWWQIWRLDDMPRATTFSGEKR